MFEELNLNISQEEVLKAINQLKANKSGGLDQLINGFFMHARDVLTHTLAYLLNMIYKIGHFPEVC